MSIQRILENREWCCYCGITLVRVRVDEHLDGRPHYGYSRDHIFPKSKFGKVTIACCNSCNKYKGTKTLEEFFSSSSFLNRLSSLGVEENRRRVPLDILYALEDEAQKQAKRYQERRERQERLSEQTGWSDGL